MNDGIYIRTDHHVNTSTAKLSPNPWSEQRSTTWTQTDNPQNTNNLQLPSENTLRGRSTSVTRGTAALANNSPSPTPQNTIITEQPFSSGLRPRAALRRLRSDQGFPDDVDEAQANISTSAKSSPFLSSGKQADRDEYIAANISTLSLGGGHAVDQRNKFEEDNAFSSLRGLQASQEPPTPGWDSDENDKTREGKARKQQGKGKKRSALPGPFSLALGSTFGSKLWEDVGNLWNETINPPNTYDKNLDPTLNGGKGGHAYLDVWGRPIASPRGEQDPSHGMSRSAVRDASPKGKETLGGPLVEREDVSTSTTPALSRRTIGKDGGRNLVSGTGADVLDAAKAVNLGSRERVNEAETEVFEHLVLPSDSLAGVALKYGISVAQLRKCNKMWASDSIHLRKVLYIPVTTTQVARTPQKSTTELQDITLTPPRPSPHSQGSTSSISLLSNETRSSNPLRDRKGSVGGRSQALPNSSSSLISSPPSSISSRTEPPPSQYMSSISESSPSITPAKSISSTPSTRRIPLSELSYFPPPSVPSTTIFTTNPHPSVATANRVESPDLFGPSSYLRRSASTSRTASPSRNGMNNSIFNVFPALNDLGLNSITARVSFETVRSGNGSLPGSGNVSGEEDVELNDMIRSKNPIEGSHGPRKRIKLRPRVTSDVNPSSLKARGPVITEQLGPNRMELPSLSKPANTSYGAGSYGRGWSDPDAH